MNFSMNMLIPTLALIASSTSFAGTSSFDCSSGVMGEDNYVQVVLKRNTVSFRMHETFLDVKGSNVVASGNAVAVLNKTVTTVSEGDESMTNVSALAVHNASKKTLNVTLVLDGHAVIPASVLKCK